MPLRQLPDLVPRKGKTFAHQAEALGWIVKRCRVLILTLIDPNPALVWIADSTLPTWRVQILHADSIYRLAMAGNGESAFPILRTMLEMRAHLAYMLENVPDPERALESKYWVSILLTNPPAIDTAQMLEVRQHIETVAPQWTAAILDRHKKGKHKHQSGLGWKELVTRYGGEVEANRYALFSWNTHAIMQRVAGYDDSNIRAPGEPISYGPTKDRAAHADEVCFHATTIMLDTWKTIKDAYSPFARIGAKRGKPI